MCSDKDILTCQRWESVCSYSTDRGRVQNAGGH